MRKTRSSSFVRLFYNEGYARYDVTHEKNIKILTHKQVLQRLPIAAAQVKTHNASKDLVIDNVFFIQSAISY